MNFESLYQFNAKGYEAYRTIGFYIGVFNLVCLIILGLSLMVYLSNNNRAKILFSNLIIFFGMAFAVGVVSSISLNVYQQYIKKDNHTKIVSEWIDQEYKPLFNQQEPHKDYQFKYDPKDDDQLVLSNGHRISKTELRAIVYDVPMQNEYVSYRLPLEVNWPEDLDQGTIKFIEDALDYWNWNERNNKFILHDSE